MIGTPTVPDFTSDGAWLRLANQIYSEFPSQVRWKGHCTVYMLGDVYTVLNTVL